MLDVQFCPPPPATPLQILDFRFQGLHITPTWTELLYIILQVPSIICIPAELYIYKAYTCLHHFTCNPSWRHNAVTLRISTVPLYGIPRPVDPSSIWPLLWFHFGYQTRTRVWLTTMLHDSGAAWVTTVKPDLGQPWFCQILADSGYIPVGCGYGFLNGARFW